MRIAYYPEVDHLNIKLRGEAKGVVAGEDVAPGVVLHTDEAGTAIEIEVDSASERLDLSRLEIEGLRLDLDFGASRESRAG